MVSCFSATNVAIYIFIIVAETSAFVKEVIRAAIEELLIGRVRSSLAMYILLYLLYIYCCAHCHSVFASCSLSMKYSRAPWLPWEAKTARGILMNALCSLETLLLWGRPRTEAKYE